nr:YfiR family protein [Deltaproteobacteria bacterium]
MLTVSDINGFLDDDGAIAFVREGTAIRFAVNIAASQQSHLQVSSKLLSLAAEVKGTMNGEEP